MLNSYTRNQREVEKWINQAGFATELEISFPPYSVDILVPELMVAVEIDGPFHLSKKQDENRDSEIFKNFGVKILRFKYPLKREEIIGRLVEIAKQAI